MKPLKFVVFKHNVRIVGYNANPFDMYDSETQRYRDVDAALKGTSVYLTHRNQTTVVPLSNVSCYGLKDNDEG